MVNKFNINDNQDNGVKNRLISYLNYKKISKSRFASAIEKSPAYVNSIRKSIPASTIDTIKRVFPDLNIDWLITGDGVMLSSKKYHYPDNMPLYCVASDTTSIYNDKAIQEIPLLSDSDLREHFHGAAIRSIHSSGSYIIPDFRKRGADFLYRIEDNAMHPRYRNGDIVACKVLKPTAYISTGKICLYSFMLPEGVVTTYVGYTYKDEKNSEFATIFFESKNNPPVKINLFNGLICEVVGSIRI